MRGIFIVLSVNSAILKQQYKANLEILLELFPDYQTVHSKDYNHDLPTATIRILLTKKH